MADEGGMVPFGEWRPDTADLNTQFVRDCRNVLPGDNCYLPAQALNELSTALGSACVGGALFTTDSGGFVIFAGTTTALYKYNSGSWTNVTRLVGGAYAVPSGDLWECTKFGDYALFTNIADDLQEIDIAAGSNFVKTTGTPPKARHIAAVGDYVILSGLASAENSLQWSGFADRTDWTAGGAGGSDIREFKDGGPIGRVSGRETGLILQRDGVRLMVFQPTGSVPFLISRVENARGSFAPYSTINVGSVTFYYGLDGFYMANAAQSQPIGVGKVNEWFSENASKTNLSSMVGVADPRAARVLWLFKSNDGGSAPYDRILGFDWGRGRWFYTIQNLEYVFPATTLGYTLEGLDALGYTLDTLPFSLDSSAWAGGIPSLAGVSTNHKLGFFDGAALEAILETGEVEPIPGRRFFTSGASIYADTADARIQLGTRETFDDTTTWWGEGTREADGSHSMEVSGRFGRAKVRIPAGSVWTKAMGAAFQGQDDGAI